MKSSVRFWQITTLLLALAAISFQFFSAPAIKNQPQVFSSSVVRVALATEIYPEFTCPCCGQPLNKKEPCCGLMQEMIDFIDQKTAQGLDKEQIELATVKKFGLERLASQERQTAVKKLLLARAPQNAPKIAVLTAKKDLGEVSLAKGTVTTEFVIKNEGQSDLVIDKLSSSCGCTSASLIYQGKEGPRFYMAGHKQGTPSPGWKVAIAPKDKARVKVYYDPTVHPDLRGAVTRTVSIHSNDPVDFATKLTITLEQID